MPGIGIGIRLGGDHATMEESIPANALLNDDGSPILNDDGSYILTTD